MRSVRFNMQGARLGGQQCIHETVLSVSSCRSSVRGLDDVLWLELLQIRLVMNCCEHSDCVGGKTAMHKTITGVTKGPPSSLHEHLRAGKLYPFREIVWFWRMQAFSRRVTVRQQDNRLSC